MRSTHKYRVTLTLISEDKIAHIRAFREATSLGLKDTKDLVDKLYEDNLPMSDLSSVVRPIPRQFIMRDDQFGRLMAYLAIRKQTHSIKDGEIIRIDSVIPEVEFTSVDLTSY